MKADQLYNEKKWDIHFNHVPSIVVDELSPHINLNNSSVLDFGCDLGVKTLGFCIKANPKCVVGVDINSNFEDLVLIAERHLGESCIPKSLNFKTISPGARLSKYGPFDAFYSWSVFEHVNKNVMGKVISGLYECLVSGGVGFVQINPLYYSPFGSHLSHIFSEPWLHLKLSDEEIKEKIMSLDGSSEQAKNNYLDCFMSLNRLRIDEVLEFIMKSKFKLIDIKKGYSKIQPSSDLLSHYQKNDLMLEGVRLILKK